MDANIKAAIIATLYIIGAKILEKLVDMYMPTKTTTTRILKKSIMVILRYLYPIGTLVFLYVWCVVDRTFIFTVAMMFSFLVYNLIVWRQNTFLDSLQDTHNKNKSILNAQAKRLMTLQDELAKKKDKKLKDKQL
jgi:hypothetical protein